MNPDSLVILTKILDNDAKMNTNPFIRYQKIHNLAA